MKLKLIRDLNHVSFLQGSRYVCESNPCKKKKIFLFQEGIYKKESFHQIHFSKKYFSHDKCMRDVFAS